MFSATTYIIATIGFTITVYYSKEEIRRWVFDISIEKRFSPFFIQPTQEDQGLFSSTIVGTKGMCASSETLQRQMLVAESELQPMWI